MNTQLRNHLCLSRAVVFSGAIFIAQCVVESGIAAPAQGPLRIHPTNPRYFTDGTKNPDGSLKAVYLTGSHTWNNQQEIEGFKVSGSVALSGALDFDRFLGFLQSYNHNFYRHWFFEFAWSPSPKKGPFTVQPHPWLRTGPGTAQDGKPKFDLTRFDPVYFDRLRSRLMAAGGRASPGGLRPQGRGHGQWPGQRALRCLQ